MFKILSKWIFASVILGIAFNATIQAQEQGRNAWLDDQTIVVARFSVNQTAPLNQMFDQLATSTKPVNNELKLWQEQLSAICEAVKSRGGKEILVVYSLADNFSDQPLIVFPGVMELDLAMLKTTFLCNGILTPFRSEPNYQMADALGATVAGTQAALARIGSQDTPKELNAQLIEPLGDNVLSLTVSLNKDQRRAAGAMVDQLPKALGSGKLSDLLAEINSLRLVVNRDLTLAVTITGQSAAIEKRLKSIQSSLATDEVNSATLRGALGVNFVDQILRNAPKQNGEKLTWTASLPEILNSELGQRLNSVLVESDRKTATFRMMSIGLALHNYYSAHERFPSVSTYKSKPRQLSWRVDLLPYLDQSALWKEFHFDEPWDSAHNKKLIPRMPEVFRCPQSKHALTSGLSNFALPVHEKAMWSKNWEAEFPGITDGTSNTIMTVEVRDELAQVWTQPTPFEIDMVEPQKQLGGHFGSNILIGAGDGSVRVLGPDGFKNLPALLTRSGGEAIVAP